jgi:galactosyl transferase GMA12/MNN10 family
VNDCVRTIHLDPTKQLPVGMIRNRIHHGADGTAPLEMAADGSFPGIPSTTERRSVKATSSPPRTPGKIRKTMFARTTNLRSTLLRWALAIFTVFLVVHESLYYLVLNVLVRSSLPGTPYLGIAHHQGAVPPAPGDKTRNTSTATTTTTPGQMAVVSLHRGHKFAGYLGTWLDGNKAQYAARHGYRYFNQDDFDRTVNSASSWPWPWPSSSSSQSLRLSKWQSSVYDRRVKFDKLRFLWSIFQRYPETEVQYALWLDGDTVIANANVTLEDRIAEFEHQLLQRHNNNNKENPELLLAWTSDGQGPNTGVVLLRNCATMRTLLATALQDTPQHTWADTTFADQASVMRAIQANATVYRDGQLLLTELLGRRLQSRVRGPPSSLLYESGDWILHLPNHNRLEMLYSLVQWL